MPAARKGPEWRAGPKAWKLSAFDEELGLDPAAENDVEAIASAEFMQAFVDRDQCRSRSEILDTVEDRVDVVEFFAGEVHLRDQPLHHPGRMNREVHMRRPQPIRIAGV